ncbi:centromere protein S-like isoform X1 [Colias croceus]|uniref:centromere protein S-like isoform X1 n=2 Tax=Colias crocea TaxID=72248 RepID=UPI001E27AAC3|nr:centromere protein S-like isoform X1 [Colias croceus]
MNTFQSLTTPQKARAALHRDVRAICTEACHFLGMEITKPAMEIIAELVYKKLEVYGSDLESFAKHAKRATVNSDDVKLLVRRNPSLKTHLNGITCNSATKEKRRKTIPLVSKPDTLAKTNKDENKEPEDEDMVVDQTIDLTFD